MWIACFSQSGTEIVEVARRLGKWPDYIFTDNKDKKSYHPALQRHSAVIRENHKKIPEEIEKLASMFKILRGETIVTLHGYLRILPEMSMEVYNGHPGDIVKYPELKGKDPQKKALDLGLKSTGTVIHKVTEEVDGGEVLVYNTYGMRGDETVDILSNRLRDISIDLWAKFLKGKV